MPMTKILIIGYGNPDREDDGVAWHILRRLALYLGRPAPDLENDGLDELGHSPDLVFVLQLMPELAETLADYDYVCFIDAHTGAYEEDIRFAPIEAEFQVSPFTHHLTPQTCLVLANTLYGHAPKGLVVSVRGYQFGFSHVLSPQTASLVEQAGAHLIAWLNQIST